MGVRRRDRALRDSLQTVLDRKGPEIQAILKQYKIPLFPIPREQKSEVREPQATSPALPDSGTATKR